jgi:putative ABC transport system permease protein
MLLTIAWRNIWRNHRRTFVLLAAVVIGVWSMITLGALMRGIENGMVKNGISTLTGHIQIHRTGYRDDPTIENSITDLSEIKRALKNRLPLDAKWAARIRVGAILSNARHSSGVTLVGIDPRAETGVSFIGNSPIQGRYLNPGDRYGILIGKALADTFQTGLGRKIIVMSQDAHGEIASEAFRVIGIYSAEMKHTEKNFAFIMLPAARELLKTGTAVSEIAIVLPDEKHVDEVFSALKSDLGANPKVELLSWKEILPLLRTYLKLYNEFIAIWHLVVFIAMSFGIVNTTLMAVFERMREFGLLKSLGMKPRHIVGEVVTESFLLLLVGGALGNILSFACVWLISKNGIDLTAYAAGMETFGIARIIFPRLLAGDVILANVIVLVLGLLVSLYPAVKAARFTPVEALAHT